MDRISFNKLCQYLKHMRRNDTTFRFAIPLEKRIAIAIYALGSSAEYRSVAHLFGVGQSTVCTILQEFCKSSWNVLAPMYLNFFPLQREYLMENIELFWQMGFPQCFGAIDGCHIEVRPSKEDATDYYNYKGWYSVVLFALVDAKYRFTYINVGNAGRCNDSSIFENSALKRELEKCSLLRDLSIRYNDTEIPALILGDSAFRLTKDVMKPFPFHTENSPLQRSFNYRLSKCRRVVENAFGHLKARFRRLGKGIDNRVGNAKSVISAACVLHNFLITEKDVVQDSWIETYDGGNRVQPAFINVDSSRNEGEKIRNVICNYIEDITMNALKRFFADKLRIGASDSNSRDGTKIFEDLSLTGLSNHWKTKGFKNIITMVGAGISTSAGIPDFRSPGSGLYDNLQKYDLPNPTAIFELDYFQYNPQPFFALAKELYPGTFTPTPTHYFIRLLHEKGLLTRHYTQNIDTLERIAGIPEKKLVEAHGTFYTNHCLRCHKSYSMEWMKEQIFSDNVPTCDTCNGLVKPDIVFFGEGLPKRFYTLPEKDFKKCDLLIIMGTSLEVQPFASLIDRPNVNCARLLINRTMVKNDSSLFNMFGGFTRPLKFNHEENTRDVAFIGDCDDGVWALAEALGWKEELKNLIDTELTSLNKKNHPTKLTIDVGHEEETAPSTSRGSNTDNEQSEEIESKQPDENEAKNDEEKAVSVYSI